MQLGGLAQLETVPEAIRLDTVLKGSRAWLFTALMRVLSTVDPSKARDVDPRYGAWILAKKANIIRKLTRYVGNG